MMALMILCRPVLFCTAFLLLATTACTRPLPEEGPLTGTSETVTVTGGYRRLALDAVERMTIENGKLVLHGASSTTAVDLPPTADPAQKNRGWALVTEGAPDDDGVRTLTFTHETSLEDFTIAVPAAEGQVAYGSLGGRDGKDVLLFAYGSGAKAYWGWAVIERRAPASQ
jgi:hypothetical protein